jgi:hypothetical protein
VTNRPKLARRPILIAFIVLAAFVLISLFFFREPSTPHVTAVFVSFPDSLRPTLAQFAVTNHSPRLVHFIGHQFPINSKPFPQQSQTIPPNRSILVELTVPEPLEAHTHVELLFRRQDTPVEEVREMLDSVLKSVRIDIQGLNQDSSANHFQVKSSIPGGLKVPPR